MMTCRELADLLLDFFAGDLPPDFCARIQEHMHECPSCEAFVHSYKITITLTRQLPLQPLPNQLAQRLHNLLQQVLDEKRGGAG
jgi:hypothetical protein